MTPDLCPWAADLSDLYAQVWARLVRGVRDWRAPARHPTLATVTPDGKPQARTVVLRTADKSTGALDIYTDLHSAKVAGLHRTPFAALHVWDAAARLQMRLEATVAILTGPDAAALSAPGLRTRRASLTAACPHRGNPLRKLLTTQGSLTRLVSAFCG